MPALRLPSWISALPQKTRLLLGGVLLLHAALGAAIGFSVDEAHYALYASHLDWSYFDHPPLVGWVQWPLVALGLSSEWLRLIPQALWFATALLVYALAQRLQALTSMAVPGETHAGLWAVLALSLAPILHVLGIGLLPDTLLMFFTAALMWQTLHLMDAAAVQRWHPWLALGLLLGLAGLSKYTAILAAAAVAICLIAAHGWALLRNPHAWAAAVLALVLVLPVAWWNAHNDWISFVYQAKHGAGSAWQLTNVLRFLVLQLLVYGPLLLWGGLPLRPGSARIVSPTAWLFAFFLVPFSVLTFAAGGGSSLPHWTAPAWVALAPFAGLGLARAVHTRQRRGLIGVAVVQAVLCLALLAMMASGGVPMLAADRNAVTDKTEPRVDPLNPFADLHGWEEAGARVRTLAQQQGLHSVAVQNWTLASRLGWYARPMPVHVLEDRFDQFDLWAGDLPAGESTLLLDWSQMAYEVPLGPHGFSDCTLIETQDVRRWGYRIASFSFYACRGWSGDPRPVLRANP